MRQIARRANWYALCAPRDFYSHYQARCDHCTPRLTLHGHLHTYSQVLLWHSVAQIVNQRLNAMDVSALAFRDRWSLSDC